MSPPLAGGKPIGALYCGNDPGAKQQVAELNKELGAEPIEAGPLSQARLLEATAILVISQIFTRKNPSIVLNLTNATAPN
jgi:predicted dinucleotide-binding enzyme